MSGYNKNTINKFIDNECYKCCGLKKQHIELSKLNLPANVVNNIIEYHYDRDDECRKCQRWRYYQHQIDCLLNIKRVHNRDVEDDVIIFLQVYDFDLPPIDYVRKFMKISERRYDIFERLLLEIGIDGTMEKLKQYLRDKKLNIKNTEKYLNLCIKLMFEYNKDEGKVHQLNYYPQIKLI